jgi:hypothetical protein
LGSEWLIVPEPFDKNGAVDGMRIGRTEKTYFSATLCTTNPTVTKVVLNADRRGVQLPEFMWHGLRSARMPSMDYRKSFFGKTFRRCSFVRPRSLGEQNTEIILVY